MTETGDRKPGDLARKWAKRAPKHAPIVTAAKQGWFTKVKELIPDSSQTDIKQAFRTALEEMRPQVFRAILKHASQNIYPLDLVNAYDDAGKMAQEIRREINKLEQSGDAPSKEFRRLHRRLTRIEAIESCAAVEIYSRQHGPLFGASSPALGGDYDGIRP